MNAGEHHITVVEDMQLAHYLCFAFNAMRHILVRGHINLIYTRRSGRFDMRLHSLNAAEIVDQDVAAAREFCKNVSERVSFV